MATSQVQVLPVQHLDNIPKALVAHATRIGPVHGVINIGADTSWTLGDEGMMRVNCEAPVSLYRASREASSESPDQPLRAMEGFVHCSTFAVAEVWYWTNADVCTKP